MERKRARHDHPLVALAGAVLRYRLGLAIGVRSFPWATLAINLSGSFVLALVLAGPAQSRWGATFSTAVAVGLLGAYTTFSTFGWEILELVRTDLLAGAAFYVVASVVGGLLLAAAGYAAGRALV